MSANHTHTPTVRHLQTLSHTCEVSALAIRLCSNKLLTSILLIAGGFDGSVSVYKSPVSSAQCLHFTLQTRVQHSAEFIHFVHFHRCKPLFISAAYESKSMVKVWNYTDLANPRLIKSLPHPKLVLSAKYSESGLLLTGCDDGVIRVYGQEPLFSLCWSFQTSKYSASGVWSVCWSPCNRIGAIFAAGDSCYVQVWDSSFQTIFKLQQYASPNKGLAFASNDLLISSGYDDNKVYWYQMSKPKVMKVFVESNVLPFCRDVLKIVIEYLPFVTRVRSDNVGGEVGPVISLSSEVAGALC